MAHHFYITPEEYGLAAQNGVPHVTLDRRIREYGWSKEKAINTPVRGTRDRRKWVEIARRNGISYYTFMSRVCTYGWNEQRAATEPLQDRPAAVRYATEKSRRIPAKWTNLARQNGIAYQTFWDRVVKRGWPVDKAATHPIIAPVDRGRKGKKRTQELYGDLNKSIFQKRGGRC